MVTPKRNIVDYNASTKNAILIALPVRFGTGNWIELGRKM